MTLPDHERLLGLVVRDRQALTLDRDLVHLRDRLSPEVAVVTGGIVRAWLLIVEDIKAGAEDATCQSYPVVKFIPSTLGSHPTLMGAFSLVLIDKFALASIT